MGNPDSVSIRVMIVDDHPFVRLGLRSYFEVVDGIELVGEADSGMQARRLVDELTSAGNPPDVVLMDILMPGGDGIDTTALLLRDHPHIAVVALTSFDDTDRVRAALQAGAIGYVLKDVGPDDVLTAIRSAAQGKAYVEGSLALRLAEPPTASDRLLTAREREVLALLGDGKSNQQIASSLVISERTARTHVSNVLRKLGLASRTQAALWAARERLSPRHIR
jgi:DNA-binding NarL/FixJ family response regulator